MPQKPRHSKHPEEWLTTADVADRLGVETVAVTAWIAGGFLPAYKIGPRCWRIRTEDFKAFITKGITP